MKRSRAGVVDGVRRPRVDTDSANTASDPIAAAAQAKREREGNTVMCSIVRLTFLVNHLCAM